MRPRNEHLRVTVKCESEARNVLQNAKHAAETYGRVTLADVLEGIGNCGRYEDTKIYWTSALLDTAVAICSTMDSDWYIHFFDYLTDEPDTENEETEDTHSIYINVTTADMDDPDCLICSVLTHAQKIWDRDIFINVY